MSAADIADLEDEDLFEAQVGGSYRRGQSIDESYIPEEGEPVDLLDAFQAKKGGRKEVDPYKLKAHAEISKRLNEGDRADEENAVGTISVFEP